MLLHQHVRTLGASVVVSAAPRRLHTIWVAIPSRTNGEGGETTPCVARAQVHRYQDGQHRRFTQVVCSPRDWGVCVSAPSTPRSAHFRGAVCSIFLLKTNDALFPAPDRFPQVSFRLRPVSFGHDHHVLRTRNRACIAWPRDFIAENIVFRDLFLRWWKRRLTLVP